jgi:NAD(P)-dependent dehydrogenase (short-subunit alcohol dehydrogenase family)
MNALDTAKLWQAVRPRYPELAGRVAVVTGSYRGIGQGIAIRLAREGMKVVVAGRNAEGVAQTACDLQALGAQALGISGDLSLSTGIEELIGRAVAAWGSVDVLVNNAADLRRPPILENDEALLDIHLATNIRAPFLLSLRVAHLMREQGRKGSIVNISSVGGFRAHIPGMPYDMTKGAIDAITRGMGVELAPYGIRVNAVAPGATGGELPAEIEARPRYEGEKRMPIRRVSGVLEQAAAVAFLVSDEASYIVGQTLYVDGGLTAQLSPAIAPV